MAAALATTTIPSAIDAVTNRVTLAATPTGIVRGWIIIADGEVMLVQGPLAVLANTFQVLRGWDGTPSVPHKAGVSVYAGPRSYFSQGYARTGACDPTKEIALPSINLNTMDVFDNSSGEWQQTKIGNTKATIT